MNPSEDQALYYNWRGDLDSFARIVAGAAELGLTQKELARDLEVAEMVIKAWANGTARPHPRIQQYVVDTLKTIMHPKSHIPSDFMAKSQAVDIAERIS